MQPLRVVVADDYPIARAGARAVLAGDPRFEVVAEAKDGLDAVSATVAHAPNVVLLDLSMPGLDGIEVIRRVRERCSETRILVFSMFDDEAVIASAFEAGADGYLLKSDGEDEIRAGVEAVASGRRFLSKAISWRAVSAAEERLRVNGSDPIDALSPREREVFQLVGEGLTSREIAGRLDISCRTVENHRSSMMKKLGLGSPRELIRYVLRRSFAAPR